MKLLCIFILVIASLCFNTTTRAAQENEPDWGSFIETEIEEQAGALDLNEWRKFLSGVEDWQRLVLPNNDVNDMVADLALGRFEFNAAKLIEQAAYSLYGGILHNLSFIAKIMALAIVCGVIRNMKDSLHNESVGEVVFFACYATIILLLIQSFMPVIDDANQAIMRMVQFMQILFPILVAFLVAVGGVVSSSIMQPAIAMMVGLTGAILRNVMMPLILISFVVVLVNHLSDKIRLNSLSDLLNNLCVWMLGGIFTIFVGVLTVQGAIAATFDGVSVRTAKYAIDAFVPIVGGMFSQAVDIVIGCSLMLKNAIGIVGLLILGLISIHPAMSVLSLIAAYKISGALLEPVTDERVVDCLNGVGNVMMMLFICIVGTAIMFFIVVTLLVAAGNMTVMMR